MDQKAQINYSQEDFTENILQNAIQGRASDVHLDPGRNKLFVRFRIDGVLYDVEALSKEVQSIVISRIKVMCQLDIVEKRIPQDGHFEFPFQGRVYNFRVSTFPTTFGEAMVLRLLGRESSLSALENLGFTDRQLGHMKKLIHTPYGIALITGPTGSGKSTLMYSILQTLNSSENNVVTIEDPVELQLDGVRQMDVKEDIGLTFATGLRSVLRQDPDILMVGEIRDPETAQMAAQAALAGRLVFSTFHTFDVPALVLRLREMGIPISIIAHALLGMVSSRLVRKICQACIEEYSPSAEEKKMISAPKLHRGKGCANCRNSGYSGRIGIFEVTVFDENIRSAVLEEQPASALRQLIRESEYETLWEAGMEKVEEGITTIEEMIRVYGLPK